MYNQSVLFFFILFLNFFFNASPYRILVLFPTGAISHQRPQQAVSEALANHGHQVTVISPDTIKPDHPNIKQINIRFAYDYIKLFDLSEEMTSYDTLHVCTKYFSELSDHILSHEPVMDVFKNRNNEKFDAIIMETLFYLPLYHIKQVYNTTLIGLSTLGVFPSVHEAMGNSIHPILHPSWFVNVPKNAGLLDRIYAVYWYLYYQYWFHYILVPESDEIVQKYFPEVKPRSHEYLKELDFLIEGVTPVLGNTRPLLPNSVQIGFLHIKKPKPLPLELQEFLDKSKHGVIYLSFGSNVQSALLKPHLLQILMKSIRQLKYDVLWKFENETLADKPENVKINKWLPQTDLLAHKNVKLFITHGGQQSMDETISRGVPVVVVPFFADQDVNADRMKNLGIGLKIKAGDLTVEKLTQKINEVINNPKYKKAVKTLADRVNDTPKSATDNAVWWIEYAIRNRGAEHLKYAAANMSFVEYFLVDVIFAHVFLLIIFLTLIFMVKNFLTGERNKEKMS